MRCYWTLSNRMKNEDCIRFFWQVKFDQIDFNRRDLSLTWMQLRKKKVYFQYHFSCQDITDKWGDIEICLMGSNRKTVSAGWQLKFNQINFNRRNVSLIWMQLRKNGSVFSISPQLSGYYRQMRWYWTLSNMIKSEDCICWLALEIRSNWLQSSEFVTYLDAIKEKESVFSISPQLSGYYWQMRWYWALSSRIKSVDCICWLAVEIRSKQHNSTEFVTYMQAIKKKKVYFHQHFNCHDITDIWGDIELCLTWSNRKIVSAGWHLKFDQIDFNRRNLSLTWMQLRKKKLYFQYHLNCQDISGKWGDIEVCLTWSNRKTVSAGWHLRFDQMNFKRRNVSLTWMQLRKQEVYFQYHLYFKDDTDKWGAIELCPTGSNRKTVSACWQLKFDQIDINHRNLSLTWMQLRKEKVYFQYHRNCQDITDKWGDIEICLMGSNRKTVSAGWQLKF